MFPTRCGRDRDAARHRPLDRRGDRGVRFGTRGAILDGNVKRVLARHAGIAGRQLGEASVERSLWARAEALLPARDIETYTQALMDLGATVCLRENGRVATSVRSPPTASPVASIASRNCRRRGRRKALPRRAITVLLLERHGEVLLERRPNVGIWAGLWSLPELVQGADAAAHCRTRFAADVIPSAALPPIEHGFTHFRSDARHRYPAWCATGRRRAEEPGLLWLPLADAGRRCAAGADQEAPALARRDALAFVAQGLASRRSAGSKASARSW